MALHNTLSQCPECDKKFSRTASLKAHILQHFEEDTLTCRHCDNEFETLGSLQHHIEEEHQPTASKTAQLTLAELNHPSVSDAEVSAPEAKIFSCKQCNVNFGTLRALKEHSRFHQKVNSILAYSKKKNSSKSGPKIVSKPRFKCKHCDITFEKPSLCARHERIHTGERPFKVVLIETENHFVKMLFDMYIFFISVINATEGSARKIRL